jgi:hypothetical protein
MKVYVCTAEDYDVHQICKAFFNEDQAKEWIERQTLEQISRHEAYSGWTVARNKAKQDKFGTTYSTTKVTYQQLSEFDIEYGRLNPSPPYPNNYGYGYEEVEVE